MIIGGIYSFNGGREKVEQMYPNLLNEVKAVIGAVDAEQHKSKVSKEKTMPVVYSTIRVPSTAPSKRSSTAGVG